MNNTEKEQLQEARKMAKEALNAVNEIKKAFPAQDVDGHRRYHQEVIEVQREKKALYRDLRRKTIFGLLWAFLVWVGVAIYHELMSLIHK